MDKVTSCRKLHHR